MGDVGVPGNWLRLPQFVVPLKKAVVNGTVTLSGKEAIHLAGSKRLRKGDKVRLADGQGRVVIAEITGLGRGEVSLRILTELATKKDLVPCTILLSIIRLERFELALAKLSEIGVCAVQPVLTEMGRFRKSDMKRLDKRVGRWQGICMESLKQSRGFVSTRVNNPLCLEDAIEIVSEARCKVALFAKEKGRGLVGMLQGVSNIFPAALAVGPEGGFSPNEKSMLKEAGFCPAGLGDRILRSETAAIYGAVIFSELYTCLENK